MKKLTLREARKRRGLSQVALALRAGLEQTDISKLELGKTGEPFFSRGLAIADALDMDPHALRFNGRNGEAEA